VHGRPAERLSGARHGKCGPVPPGSESGACKHRGPPGTWEILSSPSFIAAKGSRTAISRSPLSRCLASEGSEQEAQERYRQAKETKCGGKGGRKSERLNSTDEAGEPARWTQWRKGGRRVMEP